MSVPHSSRSAPISLDHLLEDGLADGPRVVVQVADADREADLDVQVGPVAERLPVARRDLDPVADDQVAPREAVGDAHLGIGVAVHPARDGPELVEEALAGIGGRVTRTDREEDRHVERGDRIPERPPRLVRDGQVRLEPVGVLGDDLERVQAVDLDGRDRLGDDGVRLGRDPPFVHRGHRAEPVRVGADAGRQVLDVLGQRRVHVEERPVDPRVVHVGDEVARRVGERVGRQEDLGVVVAVDRPDQPLGVVVDPERPVARQLTAVRTARLEQEARVAGRPVAQAEGRLVVAGVAPLPEVEVVLDGRMPGQRVGRREAVRVRVDDHRDSPRSSGLVSDGCDRPPAAWRTGRRGRAAAHPAGCWRRRCCRAGAG